jgi:flagellar hook-associated protein 3 FlgL
MRVTNMYLVQLAQAATAKNQSNVATLTQEVSSGLAVAEPSDNPTAWIEAQRQKVESTLNDGAGDAIQAGTNRLSASAGALSELSSIFAQAQTLAVQGANGSLDASSRAALGQQVSGLFQQAIATANSKGPDGSYLFAGTDVTQPFDPTTGNYSGNATAISVNTNGTATAQASIPGGVLDAGNILLSLNTLATALNGNDVAGIQSSITGLNTAVSQLSQTNAQVGAMMDTLQSATTASQTLSTTLQTSISNLVDADAVQSASNLAQASTALQVSQAVTTKVLSLLEPSS